MAKLFRFCAVVTVCALCASCIPESKQPLSDPNAAKQDFELHGLWVSSDEAGNKNYLHIGAERDKPLLPSSQVPEDGLMSLCLVSHEAKTGKLAKPFGMRFIVTQLGDDHYASLVLPAENDPKPRPTTYWIFKYKVAGNRLEWSSMNLKETAKLIESGRLKGEVVHDTQKPDEIKSVLITDSQEALQALLREPASQLLFPEGAKAVYTRVQ